MAWKTLGVIGIAMAIVGLLWWFSGSDEDRVRGLITDLERDFNRTKASGLIRAFSPEFLDEHTGTDRTGLLNGMRSSFFRQQGPDGYPFRAELLDEPVDVTISDDGTEAQAAGELVIYEKTSKGEHVRWRAEIAFDFRKEDGSWLIYRSRWKTTGGRMPFP